MLARRSERRAVVEACTYPHEGLHVAPCDDVAACEGVICDGAIFPAFPVGWDRLAGNDEEGWRGSSWRQPVRVGDHCESQFREVRVEVEGETLVVRSRVFETGGYPLAPEGRCTITDDAVAAIEGKPCAALEVLRIRRDNADCDPLDLSVCTDDALCVPYGHRFVCTPSVTPGPYGDPCDFESCAPGLLCVEPRWVPGCTTAGCCTRYCDASLPDAAGACEAPTEGIVCHSYYFESREQPGREHVGVCGLGLECDGETIPADWVCDGAEDCEDGADERDC